MKKSALVRLFSFMWKDGGNVLLGIGYILSMIVIASQNFMFNYFAALSLKMISDAMVERDKILLIEGIKYLGTRFLFIFLVIPIFAYIYQYSVRKTTMIIRRNLYEHMLDLPITIYEKSHTGDFLSRLNYDINVAEGTYSWQIMVLTMSLISAVGSCVVIFSIHKILFLYALIIGFLNVFVNAMFIKPIRKISDEIQKNYSKVVQRLSDIINGAFVIRAFNIGEIIYKKYVELNNLIYRLSMKRVHYNSMLASFNYSIGHLIFFGELALGGILIMNKEITFGELTASVQLMGPIFWLFGAIGNFLTNLQVSLAGAKRVFEILDLPKEELQRKEKFVEKKVKNNYVIMLKDLSFSYNGNGEILKKINMKIEENKKYAIVGPTGSGKSTILKLLLGFYSDYKGEIYILGRELRTYSMEELRRCISYVPQDVFLFNTTIYENVRYGKLDASVEEVIEALKMANAYDFVMNLPDGIYTQVGEKGFNLSGGQRQRIAIARAILKNAPILLLDEPTSSLDSESEDLVIEALNRLMENKTSIIIAHRLSTISDSDYIFVMNKGVIVEEGKHKELLALGGFYKKLWESGFKFNN